MDIHELIKQANRIETQLFIKYRLVKHPTNDQVIAWYQATTAYIDNGFNIEEAAQKAANDIFEIDARIVRKSQTDTIEALLALAKKRVVEENDSK